MGAKKRFRAAGNGGFYLLVKSGWWIVCGKNAVLSKLATNNWKLAFNNLSEKIQLSVY